jgi:hypothetical protein
VPKHTRYFVALPFAIVLASYFAIFLGDDVLDALAGTENSYFELAGAFAFLGASCAWIGAFLLSRGQPLATLVRVSYLVLALLFFLAAGEELSWGQHLIGYETPERLVVTNRQHEANVHNLEFLRGGPNRLFSVFWFGFTIVVPLLAWLWPAARRRFGRWFPVLPVAFGALFAFNYAASKAAETLATDREHHAVVEIKESNLGILFLVVALYAAFELWTARERSTLAPLVAEGVADPAAASELGRTIAPS